MNQTETQETELMPANILVTEKIGIGFGAIHAPEMTQEQAEAEAQEVASFRVRIDSSNPAVCIDGRRLADGQEKLPLGAHMAGGAETLLVGAKTAGYHLEGVALLEAAQKRGFTLGGHDADTNKAESYTNGTGCGACDKCESNCSLFAQHQSDVEPTMHALLGDDFDKVVYDGVQLIPATDKLKNIVGNGLVETLHDDGQGVHGHREQLVIFNYEENTTIDRDAYVESTGKQVFVVDVWYIKKLADAMATGVNTELQALQLYHAMMGFQVATYLGLCDGSHRAAVLQAA